MVKKIIGIFVCTLLIAPMIPDRIQANEKYDPLQGGWLEKINGINVLHISGSFYEMGYQQGYLLKTEILENLRAFNYYYENNFGATYNDFLDLWTIQKSYVSQNLVDFIQGTADGADVPFDSIAITWVYDGGIYMHRCSSFAVWGPATTNNELFFARSLDWFLDIKDPVTGKYIQENPVLIIANPEHGYSFMYPTFAGYVVEDGINEKGIAVSNMYSDSSDQTPYGTPMGVRLFETLYQSSNAKEATDIITTNETFGYNFLVCDGYAPVGYAIETTANSTYYGTWDTPTEATTPFWKIDHTVRRTNCFINTTLASYQRNPYNPKSIVHLLKLKDGKPKWFFTWLHYKSLSKGIEKFLGNIDLNTTMEIIRSVYSLHYDRIWTFYNILFIDPLKTAWQFATCPKTGDFLISYANVEKTAWKCPVNYFNFFSLLNSTPPP